MTYSTFRPKTEPTDHTESNGRQQTPAIKIEDAKRFDYVEQSLTGMEAESQKRSSEAEKKARLAEAHVHAQESTLQRLIFEVVLASKALQNAREEHMLLQNHYMTLRADQDFMRHVAQRMKDQLQQHRVAQPPKRGEIAGRRGWPSVE